MKSYLSTIPYLEYHETHFGKHWPQLLPLHPMEGSYFYSHSMKDQVLSGFSLLSTWHTLEMKQLFVEEMNTF